MKSVYKFNEPINGIDELVFDSSNLKMCDLLSASTIANDIFSSGVKSLDDEGLKSQMMNKEICIAIAWVSCIHSNPKVGELDFLSLPLEVAFWLNEQGFIFRVTH